MSTVADQHAETTPTSDALRRRDAPHRTGTDASVGTASETPRPSGDHDGTTRRAALAGAGLLAGGTVLLTACGSHDSGAGADRIDAASPVDIVAASEVPVGGVVKASAAGHTAMVSQPTQGQFKAFSATCTHQGCIVNAQDEREIVCPCHSSKFSPADGSVEGGPANSPLPEYQVSVQKGRVLIHS